MKIILAALIGIAVLFGVWQQRERPMEFISTEKAPKAIGHYSQAVKAGGFLFLSGQIAIDPKTNRTDFFEGDVAAQTKIVLQNIHAILESEGLGFADLVKVTVFLKDIEKFPEFNSVYAQQLGEHKPARSAVEVARLPKDVDIEIEAIAMLQ